jgi:hypothetical protein
MPDLRDYGHELNCAFSGAQIISNQLKEIYESLPSSEFDDTKRKISNIMFHIEDKLLPDILDVRSNFTDKVPTFEEQHHILESFGITTPISDPKVVHELTTCLELLESTCVQTTEPIVEKARSKATESVVESAIVQAINPKRKFDASIELGNTTYLKRNKNECTQKVTFVPIKKYLGEYITQYTRIHPTIHHYLYSKKKELLDFCNKCRGPFDGKSMVIEITPRMSLPISKILEYHDNSDLQKGLKRYIKFLMTLREYENVVYIHINFKSFNGCMHIMIRQFWK